MNNEFENNKSKMSGILFWVILIFLFFISVILFKVSTVSIVGWVSLVVLFVLIYLMKNMILKLNSSRSAILWVGLLILIIIIMLFTKSNKLPKNKVSDDINTKNNVIMESINYSKDYSFPDNKGTYKISVNTKDSNYILRIDVKLPKDILPEGFKWDPTTVEEMTALSSRATDNLFVCWKSPNEQPKYDRLGSLGPALDYQNNKYVLKDYNETYFIKYSKSLTDLKKYMQQGDKLEIIWFNSNEAGYTDIKETKINGGTSMRGTLNAEKGYGLHPALAEVVIPWDEIINQLNLK